MLTASKHCPAHEFMFFLIIADPKKPCVFPQIARLTIANTWLTDLKYTQAKAAQRLKQTLADVLTVDVAEVTVLFFEDDSVAALMTMSVAAIGKLVKIWKVNPWTIEKCIHQVFGNHTSVKSLSTVFGSTSWPLGGKDVQGS